MKHTYTIAGMHCPSCVAKITDALTSIDAVTDAEVSLDPPRAEVTMTDHVPLDRLNAAVADEGDYRLTEANEASRAAAQSHDAETSGGGGGESLYPLFLIVGYLLGVVLLVAAATGDWAGMTIMRHFMAGFFLVFSFFKMLDLRGFVDTYRGYDLFARRSKAYAWAYPFIELALGVAYLVNLFPVATNLVTLIVMGVGAVGVLRVLLDQRSIRCACLGTALNLPMTKVTLIEDLTMAAMAAVMLAVLYTG
jgi:copper chaperone CopZ